MKQQIKGWVLVLFCSSTALAQTGSIAGTISAAVGAGVPVSKAAVRVKNTATGASYSAQSAADGKYVVTSLVAGVYEVSINATFFFIPFHQDQVRVEAGKETRLDVRLNDGNLNTLGDGGVEFAYIIADKPAPAGPTPRTREGKPDLTGIWQSSLASTIGEPPELLAAAEAIAKRWQASGALPPTTLCLPGGIATESVAEYQLVQTPNLVVILDGGFNPTRLIYLDGREHPKDLNPSWMGHSIGRWDGDTLVVDTVGFNELGRIGTELGGLSQNAPQTEELHVTERFRRPDLGHLEVENTFDDPITFKKPLKTKYVKSLAPKDWETPEYVCAENNRDLAHMAGK